MSGERGRSIVAARPRQLLQRILEEPELVGLVRALPAPALNALVAHVGLEDAGELVALATTEQLQQLFDDDLWRSRPGQEERFDGERFSLWLEVLLEAGAAFVAEKLTELPEELVTLAFERHLFVVNLDELAVEMTAEEQDDDHLTEKALDSCLYHEVGAYQVISKRHDGWDAITSVLLALDEKHHDFLQRLLERLCHRSSERIIEAGGLYEVLSSEEMIESDAAAEREERREREGFVAPQAAASFLALARQTRLDALVADEKPDPVTRAYLRSYAPSVAPSQVAVPTAVRLVEVLTEARVVTASEAPKLLAGATVAGESPSLSRLREALRALAGRDVTVHRQRLVELGYLTNLVVAGCSVGGRAFRPVEASEAVLSVTALGLEELLGVEKSGGGRDADRRVGAISRTGADKLFRIGWHLLYRDVSLVAGPWLLRTIERKCAEVADLLLTKELRRFITTLTAALEQGRPWVVRSRLEQLDALFDAQALAALAALLDEFPALPKSVAPATEQPFGGAIELISTREQLRRVPALLQALTQEAQ